MCGMGECVFLEPLVNVREKENAVTVIMKNVDFWLGLDNNIVGAIAVHWWSTVLTYFLLMWGMVMEEDE